MKITDFMQQNILILDGGMGTLLQQQGLRPGELPERWSLSHPDVIRSLHRAYYDAGSHMVNANTFGANRLKFSEEELEAILAASLTLAKEAASASTAAQPKWVALDIGPTGRMLAPYGDLDFEEAVEIFGRTVRLGAKHGADLIFIETMNDSYETKAAVLAAKENCDLPIFVSNAYGADGKLMTGADPAAMVAMLEGLGADAVGVNCSLGPKALFEVVRQYLTCASIPVFFKPNAGLPTVVDGATVYDVDAREFAADVKEMILAGVHGAGGCCGTTPEYIRCVAQSVDGWIPRPIEPKHRTCVSSYTHAVVFGKEPVLIGERINPTGKKRFQEALRARDMDYLLKEGIAQEEKGAHILDVNVGLPEIDEPTMLRRAVCELQAVTALPLQIDTSDPLAMEAALRRYNGKPMINSVCGKDESMDTVFPLAKKYGGLVVALTLDEHGIPETAEGRVAIAERILERAEAYGVSSDDLIFDPLALTVSADPNAAMETLHAVRKITEELGCHTSLGVSNVSFGLPMRDTVTAAFFALALEQGLSAAIMNPYSYEMRKAYYTFRLLHGMDEHCTDYLAFASERPIEPTARIPAATAKPTESELPELQVAIIQGRRERAAVLAREALLSVKPLELVQEQIIPALNRVGEGFEQGTVYLPGLLMSAEAAKAAFEVIQEAMPAGQDASKGILVLATVKGDIHDIGKNIVKLLLENYGFTVYDLGRDVSPETILSETLRLHAPVVGLSALMTTTVPAMAETVCLLHERAPFCRVMVGGAVLNAEYAAEMGADAYASDAMSSVRIAEAWLTENEVPLGTL